MVILAVNTEKKHIGNLPTEMMIEIPNKDDIMVFEGKKYKVIYRYFQYTKLELEIVNVMVKPLKE